MSVFEEGATWWVRGKHILGGRTFWVVSFSFAGFVTSHLLMVFFRAGISDGSAWGLPSGSF